MADLRLSDLRPAAQEMLMAWRRQNPGLEISANAMDATPFLPIMKNYGYDPGDTHTIYEAHQMLRWAQYGFPTFELTHGLVSSLLLTDIRGQRGLRVPFPAVMLVLPQPCALPPFISPNGKTAAIRYISVNCLDTPTKDSAARYPAGTYHPIEKIRSLACERRSWVAAIAADRSSIHQDWLWPADDEATEGWVNWTHGNKHSSWNDQDQIAALAAIRLVANLCAYIESLPKLATEKAGSVSNLRTEGTPANPLRFVLGREIKLPRPMHEAAAAVAAGRKAAYRLHSRFVVRGHLRNQACGKARAERKPRWIAPFWKGPTTANGLARLYAVSEKA